MWYQLEIVMSNDKMYYDKDKLCIFLSIINTTLVANRNDWTAKQS